MSRKLDDWNKLMLGCIERGIFSSAAPRYPKDYNYRMSRPDDPLCYRGLLRDITGGLYSSYKRLPIDGDPYNFRSVYTRNEVAALQTYVYDMSQPSSDCQFDSGLTDAQAQVFLDTSWSLLEYAKKYHPLTPVTIVYCSSSESYEIYGSCGHNVPYTPPACEANLPNFDIGETVAGSSCNTGASATIQLSSWTGADDKLGCVISKVDTDLGNCSIESGNVGWQTYRTAQHSIGVYMQNDSNRTWHRAGTSSGATGAKTLVQPYMDASYNYRKGKLHLYAYANNLYLDNSDYTERWGFTEINKLKKVGEYSFDKPQIKTYLGTPLEYAVTGVTPDALSSIPDFSVWCPDGSNGQWSDGKSSANYGIPLSFVGWVEIEYLTHQE